MKKLILLIFVCGNIAVHAQDLLVKTDQSELKTKVTEISDASIKYKRWDNPDGPVYSIAKTEVFMIIYANGKRESFGQPNGASVVGGAIVSGGLVSAKVSGAVAAKAGAPSQSSIDTALDYKKIRVKYAPVRLVYWFDAPPTTLGLSTELRLVKNTLNLGGSADYFFVSGASQTMYSVYLAPYLPINRLTGNYANQDKGLFIFARVGYANISYTYADVSSSVSNATYGLGMDYFFTKHLGLSLLADKFGSGNFEVKGAITFK